jgi:hypothetical protein
MLDLIEKKLLEMKEFANKAVDDSISVSERALIRKRIKELQNQINALNSESKQNNNH